MKQLTISLFGDIQVSIEHSPLQALPTKVQWLLALLILWRERPITRSRLADTLWPDAKDPRGLLRSALQDLRKEFGEESAARLITQGHKTLSLDLTDAFVDVVEFDLAIARGDLAWAVTFYRADLLAGCREEWASLERKRRATVYASAMEKLREASGQSLNGSIASASGVRSHPAVKRKARGPGATGQPADADGLKELIGAARDLLQEGTVAMLKLAATLERVQERLDRLEASASHPPPMDEKRAILEQQADSAYHWGVNAFQKGEYSEAQRFIEQAFNLASADLGDTVREARILQYLGYIANVRQDRDRAREYACRSRDLCATSHDNETMVGSLLLLGHIAEKAEASVGFYEQALHLASAHNNREGMAHAHVALARTPLLLQKWDSSKRMETIRHFRPALEYFCAAKNRPGLFSSLEGIIRLMVEEHSPREAALLIGGIDALRKRLSSPIRLDDVEADWLETAIELTQKALGNKYAALYDNGQALDEEGVVHLAQEAMQRLEDRNETTG